MMIGFGRESSDMIIVVIGRCRVVGLVFNLGFEFAGHH